MRYADPLRDIERHMSDQEDRLREKPVCDCCGDNIQDEKALHIMGFWFCQGCMDDNTVYMDDMDDMEGYYED